VARRGNDAIRGLSDAFGKTVVDRSSRILEEDILQRSYSYVSLIDEHVFVELPALLYAAAQNAESGAWTINEESAAKKLLGDLSRGAEFLCPNRNDLKKYGSDKVIARDVARFMASLDSLQKRSLIVWAATIAFWLNMDDAVDQSLRIKTCLESSLDV
jgi:hypothetical protein